jgi:hypothetical protein
MAWPGNPIRYLAALLMLMALYTVMAAPALARASRAPVSRARAGTAVASAHSLLTSRELWSTIDVCNTPDQPDYIGIRGSMPGDGRSRDRMYMRFGLQYMNTATKHWVDVKNPTASFIDVGSGKSARQGGVSLLVPPVAGKPAFTLRGVVSFQWRRGPTVVATASRATTAGRQSKSGADPAGFSAAVCQID